MLHKEGLKTILIATVLLGLLAIFSVELIKNEIISSLLIGAALVVYILILQFFRNPKRNIVINENNIIAPADGKVVVIEETEEPEFFKDKRLQISIFMSPLNVHVNRFPIGGKVSYKRYYNGKYLVAWHPKSSTENERTTVVVEGNKGTVLFRQIAGALARRIVCYAAENTAATQGNEFGFIKFGSRVDIFLPTGTKVLVNINDKTKGGETVIAQFS